MQRETLRFRLYARLLSIKPVQPSKNAFNCAIKLWLILLLFNANLSRSLGLSKAIRHKYSPNGVHFPGHKYRSSSETNLDQELLSYFYSTHKNNPDVRLFL